MKRYIRNGFYALLTGLSLAGGYSLTGDTTDDNWYTAMYICRFAYGRHCMAVYHNQNGHYDQLGQYDFNGNRK